jgi:transcription antitermination protein NusB
MPPADREPRRRRSRSAPGGLSDEVRSRRIGRRLALAALFEAEFGQRTPGAILERHLAEAGADGDTARLAREIVAAVVDQRDRIDARIERLAPQYPVVQLARMDRAILRGAIGEVLHSATPTRVAIAEWVELARIYSGDPMRRLVNGVLGRIAADANGASNAVRAARRTAEPPDHPGAA